MKILKMMKYICVSYQRFEILQFWGVLCENAKNIKLLEKTVLKHLWYCANFVRTCSCTTSCFWMGPEDDIAAKECVCEFLSSILQR